MRSEPLNYRVHRAAKIPLSESQYGLANVQPEKIWGYRIGHIIGNNEDRHLISPWNDGLALGG